MNKDFDIEDDFTGGEELDLCPSVEMFAGLILENKPFGMIWPQEVKISWLRKIGYKVLERKPKDASIPYTIQVAVKLDEDKIPELDHSNIDDVFCSEIQSIILNWLLKIKE